MASSSYRNSRPDGWIMPRPHIDAHQRFQTYGPIQPMDEPGFFERLARRLRF